MENNQKNIFVYVVERKHFLREENTIFVQIVDGKMMELWRKRSIVIQII